MVRLPAQQSDPAPYAWQASLRREMAALGRSVGGRFADVSASRSGFVPVARLLQSPHLENLIRCAGGLERRAAEGEAISDVDMTIAVSRFARQYCGTVSAVALVGLAHGVGIDMSPRRCSVTLTNIELPATSRRFVVAVDLTGGEVLRCAQRPTSLPVTGPVVATVDELREYVWSRLFGAHYDRLFRQMRDLAPRVSPTALLWTSAAEAVGVLSDAAEEHLGPQAAARFVADRRALLDAETLAGVAGPNPLRGRLVWEPVGADPHRRVQTRRMCCLNYLLPERDGLLCENCPYLPPEDRAALVRERRTLPAGSAAGPASRRAQEVGRSRPSYQQRQRPATSQR
jgi:hypothetical protein